MLYIKWKKENELGIDIIDEQHRGIVSVINSYHYAVQSGKSREALILTKGTLDEMTELHFKTEEAILREIGYPHCGAHSILHEKLYRKMNKIFKESIENNDSELFMLFLKSWWLRHINEEDRKYTEYLTRIK